MRLRDGLLGFITGIAGFIIVGVLVTEAASPYIEFSVFIGLPAGVIGGFLLWAATYVWLGEPTPRVRRRGIALVVFGIVFLVVAIAGVLIGNLRNSQALPLAGIASVLAAIVVYGWLRHQGLTRPTL